MWDSPLASPEKIHVTIQDNTRSISSFNSWDN
jgi:hypothetical protein